MTKTDTGYTPTKHKIDVQLTYLENLTEVNINVLSLNGVALSAQDIIDAVAETLLLKYDNYDLESEPVLDS